MIERLSPPVRRFVALAVLLLAAMFVVAFIVAPLAGALISARHRLTAARAHVARMEALAARPAVSPGRDVPADLTIMALDRKSAAASFSALVGAGAARNVLTVTSLNVAPDPGSNNRLQANLALRGPEVNLVRFVHELEHGRPLIRFRSWTLVASQEQPPQLMLEGMALVGWSAPR